MNRFKRWLLKSVWEVSTGEKWDDSSYFYPASYSSTFSWDNSTNKFLLDSFTQIPEVNAVINYRAWAQSMAELAVISKATSKPVTNNESIVRILRKPNYFQTQKELWRQNEILRSVFGNEYLYFLTPFGRPSSFQGLFTLPHQNMEIDYPFDKTPFFMYSNMPEGIKYKYLWNGVYVDLDDNSILHLNDNNADPKPDNFLTGTSKLNSLKVNIRNIRAAYEARNVILENRGAIGILSNQAKDGIGTTIPMNPEEKKRVQEELERYGVMKAQYRFILTNLSLKWTQISTDLDKLRVFEEIKEDFIRVCNEFGTPPELFLTEITYDNKERAEKQFYQDTVVPSVQERVQAINNFLNTGDRSWEIVARFDHLPVFQDDIKDRSQALNYLVTALNKALGDAAITIEEYQEELRKFNIKIKSNGTK